MAGSAAVPGPSLARIRPVGDLTVMGVLGQPIESLRDVGWVGLVAAGLLIVLAAGRRLTTYDRPAPLPLAGLAIAGAILAALAMIDEGRTVSDKLLFGVTAAAVGGQLARWRRLPAVGTPLLVLPGAYLATHATIPPDRPAILVPVVVASAILAVLVGASDRIHRLSAAAPPLLAVSMFGMFVTVPETGLILPALVAGVPAALLGGPLRIARLGSAGAAASLVLLAALVADAGQARPASIVGGLGCLGVLAVEPLVRAIHPRLPPPPDDWRSPQLLGLAAIHVFVVVVAARIGGLRESVVAAAGITGGGAALAAVALARLLAEEGRGPGHD